MQKRRTIKYLISAVLTLLTTLFFGAQDASATTAPQPGGSFPKAYLEYRKAHPEQFTIRGGLRGKVERARAIRQAAQQQRPEETESLAPESASKDALVTSPQKLVSGTFQIPVILVRYSNVAANPYPLGTLQAVLFGPNPTGTLTDYYTEVSYGNITVTGTVFDWTQLPNTDAFYEGNSNGMVPAGKIIDPDGIPNSGDEVTSTTQTGQLIQDALNNMDPTINFGNFDNDGPDGMPNSGDDDGVVDFIAFVHPEIGGECTNTNALTDVT